MPDGLTIAASRIELKDDQQRAAFERLMYEKVFPTLATGDLGQEGDRHLLTGKLAPEGDLVYHWIALTGYAIHATPTPIWITERLDKLRDAANRLVADYGTFVTDEVFYDLQPWLRTIGTIPSAAGC
jgi:hypothetical protein